MADKSKTAKSRDRSPSYPAIGLRRALELTNVLWRQGRIPMLVSEALVKFGYGAKSSSGLLAISAMKKFGLIEENGSGEARTINVSGLGSEAVDGLTPNHAQVIREAALKPRIHDELWRSYFSMNAPESEARAFLLSRKFTPEAAVTLIAQFKETADFARLAQSDEAVYPSKKTLATYTLPLGPNEATITIKGDKLSASTFEALSEFAQLFKKQFQQFEQEL